MPLSASLSDDLGPDPDEYRVFDPSADSWLQEVAAEYVALRTACAIPLTELSLDGIQVLDVEGVKRRLQHATVPIRMGGNFDVLRSDLGETIAYMLLAEECGTGFGYKSVRDRETIQQPGRGIDAVGIEVSDGLKLILGEVKVSSEAANPPQVVDSSDDSLRNQHRDHLDDLETTSKKVWNAARASMDTGARNALFAAALFLETGQLADLTIVIYCLLVRPIDVYAEADFGSFRSSVNDYRPGATRFHVFRIPGSVDSTVDAFAAAAGVGE